MSINAIHVHVEEGGKYGKVGGNIASKIHDASEIDDYLWVVHESWSHVKPPLHWINDCKKKKNTWLWKKGIYNEF